MCIRVKPKVYMKNTVFIILIIVLAIGPLKISAQTSVNIEKISKNSQHQNTLKFIDNIEIIPEGISYNEPAVVVNEPKFIKYKLTENTKYGNIENCSAMQFKYATMMNREVESFNNIPLYNFIDEWWATHYRYGGTDKNGIDCSAFSSKVLTAIYGIATPRTAAEQYKLAEKISIDSLTEGDLVFFNMRGGVSHVGVYLGNNYFVHSSVRSGVTINSLLDDYYGRKFLGGGRISK